MKTRSKIALLLALVMILQCAFVSVSFAEDAQNTGTYVEPAKSTGKKAYPVKKDSRIVSTFGFEADKGTEIGNMYINGDVSGVTAEKISDGMYLRYKTTENTNGIDSKIFSEAVGGKVQVDFQFALFDGESGFNLMTYPTARGDYIMNTISVGAGRFNASSGGAPIQIFEPQAGKWYNISMYYDFDNHCYSVAVDGKMIKDNLVLTQSTVTIESYDIILPKGQKGDFGFDNLRVGFWADSEKPKGTTTVKRDSNVLYEHDFEGSTGNIAQVEFDFRLGDLT